MTNTPQAPDALQVGPLVSPIRLTRNKSGVIVDSFGDVSTEHQCVTVAVTVHKLDREGFTDEEVVRLTVPLTSPVESLVKGYIGLMLPGFQLNSWAVWCEPCGCEEQPF